MTHLSMLGLHQSSFSLAHHHFLLANLSSHSWPFWKMDIEEKQTGLVSTEGSGILGVTINPLNQTKPFLDPRCWWVHRKMERSG